MSNNNTNQNEAKTTNDQSQRAPVASSSGSGRILSNLFSRASPANRPQRLPQLDVEDKDKVRHAAEGHEDVPEQTRRTTVPPKSIMHTPSTPSREHKVSFEGDRRTGSEAPSRRSRSRNGSSRTGRGVDEFVAQNLHASGSSAPRAPTTSSTTATTARRQQQAPPSPRRQPVSLEAHPLSFPPLNTDETFLNPGNGGDDVGEFDASRPLTPDVAWEPGEREALGLGVGDQTIREEPRNTGAATRPMGFEIETIPPFELDPHSPLADVDPTFVPIRTIGGKRPGNGNGGGNVAGFETPPRPPIPGQPTIASVLGDAAFVPSSSSQPPGDIGGEFQFGTQGHLRPNANVAAENAARRGKPIPGGSATAIRAPSERYSPYQPHKEHTVLPLRAHPHSTTPGAGPSNHRQAGGRNGRRRQNNQLSERERAERRRRRQLEAAPFRPLDPYAYPIGQKKSPIPPFLEAMRSGVDWVEKRFGLGEEEDLESGHGPGPRPPLNRLSHAAGAGDAAAAEEIPMGRRPAWMRQRRSGATPARSTPTNATGNPNETEAERRARTSHVNSHRIEHEILERETRLAREREERERHRRMSHEEIRDALEHGQPVVPRTSPTRTRPPVHAHPAGVESAPAGQTRGGSKASGSRRPSPDTGSAPQEGTKAAGGLSPPTASPATHPASDPGSPIKHSSPFNLPSISLPKIEFPKPDLGPLLNVGEKDEWSLRDWIRATLIQIYRHLLLRMPSLYFNRVGRVFSEADVSQKEIAILLAQEMRGGPRSLAAWLMNQPNARRLIGGIPGIDDDSEPLLSDGQNSNSPSPNRRPLALHTDDDQSDNEAASFYDEASTLAGHGVEALPRRLSPEMKESFRKIQRFQTEWENFIDSMIKEWKTLNVVSALLLSALLTVFQIQDAQYVPVTRTAALLSLICAFMSLMFGGMYIIRFSTMRTMRKAVRWIEETHKKKQKLLWNIWIMLSLPVMWLVYSLLFFCITILGFVWTSGTGTHVDPPTDDDTDAIILGPRIGVTVVFAIGFVYFCLVLNTFRVWSGVTIGPNNDTLVNLNSPDSRANMNDLETSALALAGADNQSPPALPKTIHELDTIVPAGVGGHSQSMDALQALGPSNATRETRQQRSDEIIRGLEERRVGSGSVGSTPSVLRLEGMDLTFTPADRVTSLRHSPNLVSSTLTSTPPKFISSDLPPPNTIDTQPTPVAPTFASKVPDAAPLTAVDPLMGPNGPWGLQDPLPANSPPFTRHSQAMDLDDALPDRRTPPSTFASVYATPREEAVSEFGTINRAGGRMGGGS